MNKINIKYLQKFYNKLKENLILKNKHKYESLIHSFLEVTSNTRYLILNESSIEKNKVPNNVLDYLLNKDLIRPTDDIGYFTITAQGIWQIETEINNFDYKSIVEFLDKKFFSLFNNTKNLSEKEKIIILSMIAIRSFSSSTALNLKIADNILSNMKDLIKDTYDLLKSFHVIKDLKKDNLFGAKGNEHPVSNLIRHTVDLPKKTRGIYTAIGYQKYYLNLFKNNEVSKIELSFLLWLIFGEGTNLKIEDEVNNFCLENAYTKGIYLFKKENLNFINPKYDDIVKDAFLEMTINNNF